MKRSTHPEDVLFEELLKAPGIVLGQALMISLGLHGTAVAISFVVMLTILRKLVHEFISNERGKSYRGDRWLLDDPRSWAAFTDGMNTCTGLRTSAGQAAAQAGRVGTHRPMGGRYYPREDPTRAAGRVLWAPDRRRAGAAKVDTK